MSSDGERLRGIRTPEEQARYTAGHGRDMWLAGIKRGIELAKAHVQTTGYEDADSLDWSAVDEAAEFE